MCRRLLTAAALVGALLIPATAAQAAPSQHCLVSTNGTDNEGNLIVESTTCYKNFADVLRAAGAVNVSASVTPANAGVYLMMTWIIGIHYDGFNASGGSMSVEGVDCNGGGLPVPLIWNDRFSSTTNGCPSIFHYENTNYKGSTEVTWGGGNHNLSATLNNKTSSIKYFS